MAGKESTPKRFSAPAYYLHTVVCLLIMFGFGQLPPVEPLTPLGMNLIGIFLGVLYGWVCIEIVWPSGRSAGPDAHRRHEAHDAAQQELR